MTIRENMMTYLYPRIPEADLLVVGGDIFDTSLGLSEDHANVIISVFIEILRLAHQHGVTVQILRGTYSHDRNQCKIFETLYKKGHYTNSFKYVDILSCEYIESLDLKVLYIPDDLPYKSSESCLDAIHKLLNDMNWAKFDYVFLHGYFRHRLPERIPRLPKCTFTIEQFKDIVSRYVVCAHVHTGDITENVIYNGSFERLAHGEEEPKGYIFITDDRKHAKIEFVENKHATKFMTLDLSRYVEIDDAVSAYRKYLDGYKKEPIVHIRIAHPSSEVRTLLARITKQFYQNASFSIKADKDHQQTTLRAKDLIELSNENPPTEETLPNLVHTFVVDSGEAGLSLEIIQDLLDQL